MDIKENNAKTILIVDDEPQVLIALKRELEILPLEEPFNVVTSETSLYALEYLEKYSEEIFLVLADLRMPTPNLYGSDLLLKIHELYPDIILIMLTAYTDLPEIQKAITAEIQALIFKPWDPNMLLLEIIKARNLYKIRIDNKNLQERIKDQLKCAGELQRKILTIPDIKSEYMKVELKYEPLPDYYCGGDYHDLIRVGDERFILLIGDVSGHGIKPALITAMLKVITSTIIAENRNISVSKFLTLINKKLCRILDCVSDILVTFSALLIEPKKKIIHMSNAGQLPLYVVGEKGSRIFNVEGPAMGFQCNVSYSEKEIRVKSGDRLILFTDGLVELYSEKRILEEEIIISELNVLAASKKMAESIFSRFEKFHPGGNYRDDVTVSAVTIL